VASFLTLDHGYAVDTEDFGGAQEGIIDVGPAPYGSESSGRLHRLEKNSSALATLGLLGAGHGGPPSMPLR
jgi:hypothetical protein